MWLWTKLSAARWMDAWEDRFRGNPNFVLEVLKGGKSVRLRAYCETRHAVDDIRRRFGGAVHELHHTDWAAPAATPCPPLKVRDRLLVTAETGHGELAKLQREFPHRAIVSVPAEMAFGTGDHATTASCLRLVADVARERPPGWTVADLGCGTGLLAIAAKKLGAGKALACDFDPFAIQATRRNLTRNHVAGVEVALRDVLRWQPSQPFDVVVANLFSTVLIEAMPVLRAALAPAGDLVISGILASQAWEVFTAAAAHGLGFSKLVRRGKWVTARGGRMEDLTARDARPRKTSGR